MRIAVLGAGGLGGVIGGLLARAGEDVTFVARGAHLEAIRRRGLTVKSPVVGELTVRVPATDDPAEVGPVELIVFGVKLYDLEAAAEQMRPMVGPDTVVLPIQNGIDAAERIGRIVGIDAVIGGTALVGGHVESPGVVIHIVLANSLTFGELDGGTSDRTARIRAVLERAGLSAQAHPDVRVPIWEKLVMLAGTSGVMAVTRRSAGPIRSRPETRALFRGVVEEAVAVGRARGAPIAPDCPDRSLALLDQVAPTAQASMLVDLLNGRRLELESLTGAAQLRRLRGLEAVRGGGGRRGGSLIPARAPARGFSGPPLRGGSAPPDAAIGRQRLTAEHPR
jgi:2-dehydropantoate 2-reductase